MEVKVHGVIGAGMPTGVPGAINGNKVLDDGSDTALT